MKQLSKERLEGIKRGENCYTHDDVVSMASALLEVVPDGLLSSMEEVLRISDRYHEAWHRAKSAMDVLKRAAPNMLDDESLKDPGGALCGKRKPDAWIPCSERMPDDDTYVVASDIGHGEIYGAFAAWFIHGRFSVMEGLSASNYDGGAMIEIDMPITHWQPLPAPPKDRK